MSATSLPSDEGRADDPAAECSGEEEEEEEELEMRRNDDGDDEDDEDDTPSHQQQEQQQEQCKPWEAPPPPEWLEHHRTELWPTYDPSRYKWPERLADLMHTPVRFLLFE